MPGKLKPEIKEFFGGLLDEIKNALTENELIFFQEKLKKIGFTGLPDFIVSHFPTEDRQKKLIELQKKFTSTEAQKHLGDIDGPFTKIFLRVGVIMSGYISKFAIENGASAGALEDIEYVRRKFAAENYVYKDVVDAHNEFSKNIADLHKLYEEEHRRKNKSDQEEIIGFKWGVPDARVRALSNLLHDKGYTTAADSFFNAIRNSQPTEWLGEPEALAYLIYRLNLEDKHPLLPGKGKGHFKATSQLFRHSRAIIAAEDYSSMLHDVCGRASLKYSQLRQSIDLLIENSQSLTR